MYSFYSRTKYGCLNFKFIYSKVLWSFFKTLYIYLYLTQFDMEGGGGGHDIKNVFDHCAQTLKRRKLKVGDF